MWISYIFFGLAVVVFVLGVGSLVVNNIQDRRNRVWKELQRTNYERRRPAAK
jgi:hypothetical protein